MNARQRLAADQSALLAALVAGAPLPSGFDPGPAAAVAESLRLRQSRASPDGGSGKRRRRKRTY